MGILEHIFNPLFDILFKKELKIGLESVNENVGIDANN